MSGPVSYHTIKEVAAAQRHSLQTMLTHYMVVPAANSPTTMDDIAPTVAELETQEHARGAQSKV